MNEDVILLILRILAGLTLFGFIGAVGMMIWRDFRQVESLIVERAKQRGRLIVSQTSSEASIERGHVFALLPVTTVGRAIGNTIQLDEPFVSNEHAVIEWRAGRWWIEDLNSSNGTTLNNHPITEPTILSAADLIGFGPIQFKLELDY